MIHLNHLLPRWRRIMKCSHPWWWFQAFFSFLPLQDVLWFYDPSWQVVFFDKWVKNAKQKKNTWLLWIYRFTVIGHLYAKLQPFFSPTPKNNPLPPKWKALRKPKNPWTGMVWPQMSVCRRGSLPVIKCSRRCRFAGSFRGGGWWLVVGGEGWGGLVEVKGGKQR